MTKKSKLALTNEQYHLRDNFKFKCQLIAAIVGTAIGGTGGTLFVNKVSTEFTANAANLTQSQYETMIENALASIDREFDEILKKIANNDIPLEKSFVDTKRNERKEKLVKYESSSFKQTAQRNVEERLKIINGKPQKMSLVTLLALVAGGISALIARLLANPIFMSRIEKELNQALSNDNNKEIN